MKKKISVFTGTRAEYGLLYWLLKDIVAEDDLELQLIVSGMHLSHEFNHTVRFIEQDGFSIAEKVEMLLSSDSSVGVAKSMGLGIIGYADALARLQPDVLVVLGDRFEALAIAQAALVMKVPILHIHGGEKTEGAYDDAIRHAITKFSYFHATTTDVHRNRVIQLGEDPERVWNVGAIGLDHIARSELMSRDALARSLEFDLDDDFFVVTYHPVTLAEEQPKEAFGELLKALDSFPKHRVILTYPNADDGGRQIMHMLKAYGAHDPARVLTSASLGQQRYLSAVKHCSAVIGNSSSGIIEVPSFHKPTINIGMRQKGRVAAQSVIHCEPSKESISAAIHKAISPSFKAVVASVENPYGIGNASGQIVDILKHQSAGCLKNFRDCNFSC
ncbi:MAG: UDP-N-acetylglucosamine 2-epimerase (hydrolyzing) [Gammaproteobacteria bacterium]|nr:UDP-N-acetylglucosamine 2-epimerase (hydrolyzing) [Gammaproteobacteria bacterium]